MKVRKAGQEKINNNLSLTTDHEGVGQKWNKWRQKPKEIKQKKIFLAILFCGGARIFFDASSFFPLFTKNKIFLFYDQVVTSDLCSEYLSLIWYKSIFIMGRKNFICEENFICRYIKYDRHIVTILVRKKRLWFSNGADREIKWMKKKHFFCVLLLFKTTSSLISLSSPFTRYLNVFLRNPYNNDIIMWYELAVQTLFENVLGSGQIEAEHILKVPLDIQALSFKR